MRLRHAADHSVESQGLTRMAAISSSDHVTAGHGGKGCNIQLMIRLEIGAVILHLLSIRSNQPLELHIVIFIIYQQLLFLASSQHEPCYFLFRCIYELLC